MKTGNHRPLHGACIHSSSPSFSSLPLHLSPLYPTHSALRVLSSGEVAWSYIIHGSCDLRRMSYGRSNKMEYRWGYDEHWRETQASLSLFLAQLFLLWMHSFDLYWNGWPRLGQHNRCCFEILELLELCSIHILYMTCSLLSKHGTLSDNSVH